jgi:hypothetical protein
MSTTIDGAFELPFSELLDTYHKLRRQYVEQKHARDTAEAQLEWQRAHSFNSLTGSVTERRAIVDGDKEFAVQEQKVRDLTKDLDLLKADVDVMLYLLRMRLAETWGDEDEDADLFEDATDTPRDNE